MYNDNEQPDRQQGQRRSPGPRGVNRANPRGVERRRQNPGPPANPAGFGGMHDTHQWNGTPSQQLEVNRDDYRDPRDKPADLHPADEPDVPREQHPAMVPPSPMVPMVPVTPVDQMAPQPPTPPRWRKHG